MQLSVTFRHMDSTDALRDYAREKVERIRKYFPDPIKAHVVLVCDRGYNHTADVMITLHNGLVIKGVETTEDMYSSIDLVMAKIERQVRRYKEKIRSHKGAEGLHGQREITHSVLALPEPEEGRAATGNGHAAAPEPKIIKKSKFFAKPLTPNEVNVVYRRGDGTYGLIEAGHNDDRQGGG
jgi:putative sigma-54 modulation protein